MFIVLTRLFSLLLSQLIFSELLLQLWKILNFFRKIHALFPYTPLAYFNKTLQQCSYHKIIRIGHCLLQITEILFRWERSIALECHLPLIEEPFNILILHSCQKFAKYFLGFGFQLYQKKEKSLAICSFLLGLDFEFWCWRQQTKSE